MIICGINKIDMQNWSYLFDNRLEFLFSNFSYLFIHLFMTKYINKIRATVGTILQILIPKKKKTFIFVNNILS